jgi:hypothetical protein
MTKSIITILLASQILLGETVTGRFVAYDTSPSLQNYRSPRQRFIVEVEDEKANRFRLVKAVYFVPTKGTRSTTEEIVKDSLDYRNVWRFYFSPPERDEERRLCAGIDNFSRDNNGKAYVDKKREPVTVFYSSRFSAEMIFTSLSDLPCFVLGKIESAENRPS